MHTDTQAQPTLLTSHSCEPNSRSNQLFHIDHHDVHECVLQLVTYNSQSGLVYASAIVQHGLWALDQFRVLALMRPV